MKRFKIIFWALLLPPFYCCQAQKQIISFPYIRDADINQNKMIGMNYPPVDYYVLDGLYIFDTKKIPQNLVIERVLRIKDSVELKQMGIIENKKAYAFYISEMNSTYENIYKKVDIPVGLYNMKIPLIINDRLIFPKDYSIVEKLNIELITDVIFLSKDSPLLKQYKSIVFGAIKIRIEDKK